MKRIYDYLASLSFGLWLMCGVMILLAAGSFSDSASEGGGINDLPLFLWLRETPGSSSWWLWGTLALLALLVLNTILCSIESLRMKAGRSTFLLLIAPQVMHLGFLLIVTAHLFSAYGGFKRGMQVTEGYSLQFPDGTSVRVAGIRGTASPMGFLTAFSADLQYSGGRSETISPNHPSFHQGFGIYIKDASLYPVRAALLEVHREPGAPWALAGALLFLAGNLVLLAKRR